jgi:hypothetical protein
MRQHAFCTGRQSETMETVWHTRAVEASSDGWEAKEGTEAHGPGIAERTAENKNTNVDGLARQNLTW